MVTHRARTFTRCRCGEQVEIVKRDDGTRTVFDAEMRKAQIWPDGTDIVNALVVHRCPQGR